MKKMLLTLLVCLISALAIGSDGTRVLGERVCKDVKPFSALSITKTVTWSTSRVTNIR